MLDTQESRIETEQEPEEKKKKRKKFCVEQKLNRGSTIQYVNEDDAEQNMAAA